MDIKVGKQGVYKISEEVVAREIEGEIIIVPLIAGIGDLEDDLFTLNETGKAIWDKVNGRQATEDEIKRDVLGLVGELVHRRILVAVEPD
jgi:hypothetical protein